MPSRHPLPLDMVGCWLYQVDSGPERAVEPPQRKLQALLGASSPHSASLDDAVGTLALGVALVVAAAWRQETEGLEVEEGALEELSEFAISPSKACIGHF